MTVHRKERREPWQPLAGRPPPPVSVGAGCIRSGCGGSLINVFSSPRSRIVCLSCGREYVLRDGWHVLLIPDLAGGAEL